MLATFRLPTLQCGPLVRLRKACNLLTQYGRFSPQSGEKPRSINVGRLTLNPFFTTKPAGEARPVHQSRHHRQATWRVY
jgi:hypothetical protein